MLYSFKNQYPQPLPHRIILSNGQTRTDSQSFTQEEIADAGYVAIEDPPEAVYPNKLEWSGTVWSVKPPDESDIQQQIQRIQDQCQQMLYATDYKVIKTVELGLTIDPKVVAYRQQLRDLYNSTTDIWNVTWPVLETTQ